MMSDDDGGQVEALFRRLRATLPSRVGPKMAAELLANFGRLLESGLPAATVLASLQPTVDAFEQRPAIASPWSSAMSRAIATVAPKKLAHFSFLGRTPRRLPDTVVGVVAEHAEALRGAYGDLDFALAVAWQNILTFHCALVGGECWNRNDTAPVIDLRLAAADARLADDDVPMALRRGQGLLVARGHVPPREDTPWVCREVQVHHFGFGRETVAVVGEGSFEGVLELIRRWRIPLDVAHLPLLLSLITLPCPPGAEIVDVDGVIDGLAAEEDRLEQARLRGSDDARVRLGLPLMAPAALPTLRLEVGGTGITLRRGDTRAVVEVD